MPGVVIHGREEAVDGLVVKNWNDDPRLRIRMPEDGAPRSSTWVRNIILHTTLGIPGGKDHRPQVILPGLGPSTDTELNIAHFWSTNGAAGGAHLIVDFDGSVSCLADLQTEVTYHATSVNSVSIGIEIAQRQVDAALYEEQLVCVVQLVDWLTKRFRIQRQIPSRYTYGSPIGRLVAGGRDIIGVAGHRDQTTNRGPGDPGDRIFELLRDAGYEPFDFSAGEDRTRWAERQRALYMTDKEADGIPGPNTCLRLEAAGYKNGLWISRPGDE